MHSTIQTWVTDADVEHVKLTDHDAYRAPGLIDIKFGDHALSLVEGTLSHGDAVLTLDRLISRLTAARAIIVDQREHRRTERAAKLNTPPEWEAADEAVSQRETEEVRDGNVEPF